MNSIFQSKAAPSTDVPTGTLTAFAIDPANEDSDKPIFYHRVRSNMIAYHILGSLDKDSLKSLKLQESKYLWKNTTGEDFYDGATMFQLLIEKANPSTRVGVSNLKGLLRNTKAATFSYNVGAMTDKMSATYNEITQRGSRHEDYVMDLFNALLFNKNKTFTDFIQRKKDAWDVGGVVNADVLIRDAVVKYNNMIDDKEWKTSEPGDAKIVALTTQLKALQDKFNAQSNGNGRGGGNPLSNQKKFDDAIPAWRFKKTLGAKVDRNGKTWHWCHHQHNDGKETYVTHHPDNHTEWLERKEKIRCLKKERSNGGNSDSDNDSKPGEKKNIALSDKPKAAMATKFRCSNVDAEKLWSEVVDQSN